MSDEPYTYLGNYSAVDPAYSRGMACHECKVEWTGCWDNFQCPKCGEGELPFIGDAAEMMSKILFRDEEGNPT